MAADPSRDLLQPDLLEDVVVSVCLKQHGLESALELLGQSASGGGAEETEDHCSLLDAVFTRINGLERRLQVTLPLSLSLALSLLSLSLLPLSLFPLPLSPPSPSLSL